MAEYLSVDEKMVEFSKGDWRVLLFSVISLSQKCENQLRQRADFDEFGMPNKQLDKATWLAVMASEPLAAKIGWALNKNSKIHLQDIITILNAKRA